MSSCYVQLDNYQGQYYAGSLVTGRVICVFNSPKNVRGIKLKLTGEEQNEWTGTESYYDHHEKRNKTRHVHYRGYNKFLHLENSLMGGGEIAAGRYEYPFSLQLPVNIPSTYQGRYGGIFFTVEAKVDRPYKFDFTDAKQVVVASPINFNNMRDLLELNPVNYSDEKNLCCGCCASGPITMSVQLEKEAFVAGEVANIRVDITNMSNESIESVKVELIMNITSYVTIPRSQNKSDRELLAISSDTGVGAHGERTYNFALEIPQSAVIPNFSLCELFTKMTKLKVTAYLPGCHQNLEIKTYVTMGHIPLYTPSQNGSTFPYPPNLYPPSMIAPPYTPSQGVGGFDGIGFAVPQAAGLGPSAPPTEGGATAPIKGGMAEGQDGGDTDELPPPSYSEAITYPTKY